MRVKSQIRGSFLMLLIVFTSLLAACSSGDATNDVFAPAVGDGAMLDQGNGNGPPPDDGGDVGTNGGPVKVVDPPPTEP